MTKWTPDLENREGPIYRAIADAIEEAVNDERLPPGSRLPTQRSLARELDVTVGTIGRAYREAEERGLLVGEVGRGTFVREARGENGEWLSAVDETEADRINLSVNFPPPVESESELLSDTLTDLAGQPGIGRLLHYHPTPSTPAQRRAGRRWLSTLGLDVPADRVVPAAGGQHALTALFASMTRPGDVVLAESLTYPGLRTIARMFALEVEAVETDEGGLDPDSLERACRHGDVKALYCLPTLQNPTAATLSRERRQRIAEICRAEDVLIVEDDIYAPLLSDPPAPITSYAPDAGCYISSLSKSVAPGLRVAFMAVSEAHRARIEAGVRATMWMPPPLTVELAVRWIDDGRVGELIEARREVLRRRNRIARETLDGFEYRGEELSPHLWLTLPEPWSSRDFVSAARERDVLVTDAELFCIGDGRIPPAVRVCVGAPASEETLARGLSTIRELLEDGPHPSLTTV